MVSGHGVRGSVGDDPFSPEEDDPTDPKTHAPHPPQDSSHMTAVASEDVPEPAPAVSADSEARDVVMELPSTSGTSLLGKGKRSRSETESRGAKVNILPFKGRKRSHTFQEGGVVKEKDELEDVSSIQYFRVTLPSHAGYVTCLVTCMTLQHA